MFYCRFSFVCRINGNQKPFRESTESSATSHINNVVEMMETDHLTCDGCIDRATALQKMLFEIERLRKCNERQRNLIRYLRSLNGEKNVQKSMVNITEPVEEIIVPQLHEENSIENMFSDVTATPINLVCVPDPTLLTEFKQETVVKNEAEDFMTETMEVESTASMLPPQITLLKRLSSLWP